MTEEQFGRVRAGRCCSLREIDAITLQSDAEEDLPGWAIAADGSYFWCVETASF
jgi:hypothetical protein